MLYPQTPNAETLLTVFDKINVCCYRRGQKRRPLCINKLYTFGYIHICMYIYMYIYNIHMQTRGLRVEHFCYPTRTRNTGMLPVPDPTRSQNCYPTRPVPAGIPVTRTVPVKSLARLLTVPVPTRLIGLPLSMK